MQRLGIMGGTFNPVHLGHTIIAQDAMEQFDLTQVLFVPCALPPHKKAPHLAPAAHRMAMVEAAIEGDMRYAASDIEIRRGGKSYAIDTIRELRELHPRAELRFIIGSDSLPDLHCWKDIYELLGMVEFLVFERPSYPLKDAAQAMQFREPWPDKILRNSGSAHRIEISSSDIRHRLAEGLSIRYMVPTSVEVYISEHRLYSSHARLR